MSFSSQYYPEKYSSKLKELDEILNKHLENATILPGLLIHDTIKKSDYTQLYDLNSGKIILSVYSYHQKHLYYRLANGTDKEKKIDSVIRLYRDGESVPIYENSSERQITLLHTAYMKIPLNLISSLHPVNTALRDLDMKPNLRYSERKRCAETRINVGL